MRISVVRNSAAFRLHGTWNAIVIRMHDVRITVVDMPDENVFQWVVRGVERGLARKLVETAGSRRLTVGELLNEVLREWGASQDASVSSSEARTVASESSLLSCSGNELEAIRERLTALEEALASGATMTASDKASRKRPEKRFEAPAEGETLPARARVLSEQQAAEAVRLKVEEGLGERLVAKRLGEGVTRDQVKGAWKRAGILPSKSKN